MTASRFFTSFMDNYQQNFHFRSADETRPHGGVNICGNLTANLEATASSVPAVTIRASRGIIETINAQEES